MCIVYVIQFIWCREKRLTNFLLTSAKKYVHVSKGKYV